MGLIGLPCHAFLPHLPRGRREGEGERVGGRREREGGRVRGREGEREGGERGRVRGKIIHVMTNSQ